MYSIFSCHGSIIRFIAIPHTFYIIYTHGVRFVTAVRSSYDFGNMYRVILSHWTLQSATEVNNTLIKSA